MGCCCCCSKIPFPEPQGPHSVSALIYRFPSGPQSQIFYPSVDSTQQSSERSYWRSEVTSDLLRESEYGCCVRGCLHCYLGRRLGSQPHPCGASIPPANCKFPVVIFSHGLYGSLEMYTSLCYLVASFGFVVIALEHEDGSALYATPEGSDSFLGYTDMDPEPQPPRGWDALTEGTAEHYSWCLKSQAFHQEQRREFLDKRLLETKAVLHALTHGTTGSTAVDWGDGTAAADVQCPVIGAMDTTKINLMGHSFGSASTIDCSLKIDFKFNARVMLDLWATPVPTEDYVQTAVPSLFIGSEQFKELPMTKVLARELADKSSHGLNRTSVVDGGLLVRHDVEYTNLKDHREIALHDGPPPCELLYMSDSVHQQCSDTPQFCPGWLGRKFFLTGDTDWQLQQHVLSETIARFLATHNSTTPEGLADSDTTNISQM